VFRHLVVPLDGSRLAEAAVAPAVFLATRFGASLTLLHIIEQDAPPAVHGQRHLTAAAEAQDYLQAVARDQVPEGIVVRCHVHTSGMSDLAKGIVVHVAELSPDMIVMCTHGQGGLGHLVFGSIAQQVVAQATTPVLLIRPSAEQADFSCLRVVVPLDGNPEHEEGLRVAGEVAGACHASIHLVLVVPTMKSLSGREAMTGLTLPHATRALLELSESASTEYLQDHEARLEASGLEVTSEVRRGDPLSTIVQLVESRQASLVVLGTHGKAGLQGFWSRSLSPKLAARLSQPLLLVPVAEPGAADAQGKGWGL
jgi:nucleotide-binding universal stress UspA family protein